MTQTITSANEGCTLMAMPRIVPMLIERPTDPALPYIQITLPRPSQPPARAPWDIGMIAERAPYSGLYADRAWHSVCVWETRERLHRGTHQLAHLAAQRLPQE